MKLTSILRVPSFSKYYFPPLFKEVNQKLKPNKNSSAMACYVIFVGFLRVGNILDKYGVCVSSSPPSAFQDTSFLEWKHAGDPPGCLWGQASQVYEVTD